MANNFDFRGLQTFNDDLVRRFANEYPQEAKKTLNTVVGKTKAEAIARTPVGKKKKRNTKRLKTGWKHVVKSKKGNHFGVVRNGRPHAHLVENGHFAEDGTWVEGKHMLENTITNKRDWIDSEIEKMVDRICEL